MPNSKAYGFWDDKQKCLFVVGCNSMGNAAAMFGISESRLRREMRMTTIPAKGRELAIEAPGVVWQCKGDVEKGWKVHRDFDGGLKKLAAKRLLLAADVAYSTAIAYLNDLTLGIEEMTVENVLAAKHSIYQAECEGQRAVDDALAILRGEKEP